jgi:hypothetical protein
MGEDEGLLIYKLGLNSIPIETIVKMRLEEMLEHFADPEHYGESILGFIVEKILPFKSTKEIMDAYPMGGKMVEHNIIIHACVLELFKDMKDYNYLHSKVYPTASSEKDFIKKVNKPIKFKKILKKVNKIVEHAINIQTRFKTIEPNKLTDNYNNVRPYVESQISLFKELIETFMVLVNKFKLLSINSIEYPLDDLPKDNSNYQGMRQKFLKQHEELLEIMDKNK